MTITLPEICTPEEVSKYLKWKTHAVIRAVHEKRLRGSILSAKVIRIRREDVFSFLENTCPAPPSGVTARSDVPVRGRAGPSGGSHRALHALAKVQQERKTRGMEAG
jgi:hypothetical protein